MNKIHICHGCGRTVDSSFLYCPWCGFSRLNNRETDSLDEVFRQLETVQLEKMYSQLEELEKELDILVLSTEMHK